jgi:signal transduction histidine kinase
MTGQRGHDVRRASIRVALGTSAAVAGVYLAIAIGVFAIVSLNLTARTDADLQTVLQHTAAEQMRPGGGGGDSADGGFPLPPDRGPLDPNTVIWTVLSNGTVFSPQSTITLPAAYQQVTSPVTANLAGTQVRLAGMAIDGVYVVVGQNMAPVEATQANIVLAELIIGPILLVVVFLGAVAIGRRVATPIEVARQRQVDFSADASHELRTPLSVIEAHTSLALTQDRPAAWYREAFGHVDAESKRMRRLLDDLLWLARFDASRGQPSAEPVDVGVLATQAVDRFTAIAESQRQTIRVDAPDKNLAIVAPPDWLDRLLGVLLDNACKYSPNGGRVDVAVIAEDGRVTLSVDDSGPGIPEAERTRIFDRFHRANDGSEGAGLGLAIGDEIVRATGGRWHIGASPTGGARMAVSWPRAPRG